MSLSTALTQIKTWTFTGLTTNYGIDIPATQPAVSALPALYVDLFSWENGDVRVQSVDETVSGVVYYPSHRLLVRGVNMSPVPAEYRAALVTLVDNYFAAAAADQRLNDSLVVPVRMGISFAPIIFNGLAYNGVTFIHRWELRYT